MVPPKVDEVECDLRAFVGESDRHKHHPLYESNDITLTLSSVINPSVIFEIGEHEDTHFIAMEFMPTT